MQNGLNAEAHLPSDSSLAALARVKTLRGAAELAEAFDRSANSYRQFGSGCKMVKARLCPLIIAG